MTASQIGRYRIVSKLGAGGMGEVFLAEDTTLGRSVALKVLTSESAGHPDRRRRFVQEAQLASAISHPNIAQIFEIGDADGVSFIAMEYVEGEPLNLRVQRGPLSPADTIDIGMQIFDAVDEAHGRGIIHRDLKPANIVMTPRGRVKILDFGLATVTATAAGDAATRFDTTPGVILGTVHYMSPEQALGRDVDPRSDIFSAGVVLFELVTGRLPFSGTTITDTLDRVVHSQPESISRLNYGAPAELERIIRKALEKEPVRRYQTARDAWIDLNNLKRDSDTALPRAPGKRARSKAIESIAVLPLATGDGDADAVYLADGITETLIDALSQLPKLKVMARSSVFRYKGLEVDPQQVGRDLGVRAVLIGRLQPLGEHIITKAELVDTSDGSHVWGGQFKRHSSDVFALQEELAREIADQLRLRLTQGDRKRLLKRHTENARAYESYMRGRFQLAKRTPEGFTKAIVSFGQAIDADPKYALAYAGLADCYTLLGTAAYRDTPADATSRARDAAERATALDDQLAEAHAALGFVRFRIDWDWSGAETSLKRACRLNPGYAPAHHHYALLLSALGRHAEALTEIGRASELDPLSLIIGTAHGRVLHFGRRYAEAIERLRRTLDMDPQFAQAHFDLAMSFGQAGRHEDAVGEIQQQLNRGDGRSVVLAVLGYTYARSGQTGRAREVLNTLVDQEQGTAFEYAAYVHAGLGEAEQALDSLERSFALRSGLMVWIQVEPMLDELRGHPRFIALLQRMKLSPGPRA